MWLLVVCVAWILQAAPCRAANGSDLKIAILELPAPYFADVPLKERSEFLLRYSDGNQTHPCLDYAHGWFHFFSDNPHYFRHASSQIYLKLLPRKGATPLVLVHLPKSIDIDKLPKENQTFVLEREESGWKDVTRQVIPQNVDLTMHFRPRRLEDVIEVGPYQKFTRRDGRGEAWGYGDHQWDLVWNGQAFRVRKAARPAFSDDDR